MVSKNAQKNIDWIFIAGIVFMMLVVAAFHTSIGLKKATTPPSDKWGRSIKLGESTVVSPPFLKNNKGSTEIEWASSDGIHHVRIDEKGRILNSKIIKPSYINFDKLIAFQQAGSTSGWLEGPILKITTLMSETSPVKTVNDFFQYDIRDFKFYSYGEELYIGCISKSELGVFHIIGGNLIPVTTQLIKKELVNISINADKEGRPIVVYAVKEGSDEYSITGEILEVDGSAKIFLKDQYFKVKPTTSGSSNKLINIDTLFDGEKLWVSYETGAFRSQTMNGEVYYENLLPSGSKNQTPSVFKRVIPLGMNGDEIGVRDFSFLKSANNGNIKACFGLSTKDSDAMEIMDIDLSVGEKSITSVTNNGGWNKYGIMAMTADGVGAGYLKVVGGQKFEVYYTGNYEPYKGHINSANWSDITTAISNNVIYLIIASVMIAINIPLFLLMVALIVLIQSFKSYWIDRNEDLAFLITGLVHWAIKIFVFTHMLGDNVVKEIPSYLSGRAPFIFTISIITILSFAIIYHHVKKNVDRNLLVDYFKALALDLIVSMFLIGPFVFEKL